MDLKLTTPLRDSIVLSGIVMYYFGFQPGTGVIFLSDKVQACVIPEWHILDKLATVAPDGCAELFTGRADHHFRNAAECIFCKHSQRQMTQLRLNNFSAGRRLRPAEVHRGLLRLASPFDRQEVISV